MASKVFISFIAFVIGMGCFIKGAQIVIKAYESHHWPSVEGNIIQSSIRTFKNMDKGKTTITYSPFIQYSYEVSGHKYFSEQVNFNNVSSSDKRDAQEILSAYPKGSMAKVYYNPENHAESVLINGLHLMDFFMVLFGLIFCSVPLFIILDRQKRNAGSQYPHTSLNLAHIPGHRVFKNGNHLIIEKSWKTDSNNQQILAGIVWCLMSSFYIFGSRNFSILQMLFTLPGILILTHAVVCRFNKTLIDVDHENLTISQAPLSMTRPKKFHLPQIAQLSCQDMVEFALRQKNKNYPKLNAFSATITPDQRLYCVSVHLKNGQEVVLMQNLTSLKEAQLIEREIEEHLGIKDMSMPNEMAKNLSA